MADSTEPLGTGKSRPDGKILYFMREDVGDMKNKFAVMAGTMMAVLALGMGVYAEDAESVKVGALKGPTSMGLVSLMDKAEKGETNYAYDFTMATAADEVVGAVAAGNLDIALVPANVASVLYNKTEGGVQVIDINTLGVLYVVSSDAELDSMDDLAGKTIYLTGKGTSPDYVLQYLLASNGVEDAVLEYKSEATEVVSVLAEDETAIGVLPQPFATAALQQNESFQLSLDLTGEWEALEETEGSLVTGVTIVRAAYAEEHPEVVADFLEEHAASAEFTNSNVEEASQMIADLGIVAKAPIAQKAIPYCNITCITGEEMRTSLEGYLQVLYDFDPAAVGGALPEDGFYYAE